MNCPQCGAALADGAVFCPACGASIAAPQPQTPYEQPVYQQPIAPAMQPAAAPAPVQDKGSIGWGILGFLFPIVGLILFLVWRNNKPNSAKVAGIGAIIGFVLGLVAQFAGAAMGGM